MEQIAIYLRLSKEDEFVKDESNSITNQRAFIRGFINKNKELRKMSVMEFACHKFTLHFVVIMLQYIVFVF